MASASIHYIPVSKETIERLAAARKAVSAQDADMLNAPLPYPSFSGQAAGTATLTAARNDATSSTNWRSVNPVRGDAPGGQGHG